MKETLEQFSKELDSLSDKYTQLVTLVIDVSEALEKCHTPSERVIINMLNNSSICLGHLVIFYGLPLEEIYALFEEGIITIQENPYCEYTRSQI